MLVKIVGLAKTRAASICNESNGNIFGSVAHGQSICHLPRHVAAGWKAVWTCCQAGDHQMILALEEEEEGAVPITARLEGRKFYSCAQPPRLIGM